MDNDKKMHSGNLFFKHKFPSIDLEQSINYIDSFEKFEEFYTDELIDGNVLLAEYLMELMRKYKTSARELAEATGYHYDYIRKVKKGEKTNPERNMLLAICAHMRVTVEEAQVLLRYAGEQPLYARRRSDAIIWYALSRKLGLQILDLYLESRGYPMLTKPEKE